MSAPWECATHEKFNGAVSVVAVETTSRREVEYLGDVFIGVTSRVI